MTKKFLFSLCLFGLALLADAREWTAYMSYQNATRNIPVDDVVYTLANGGLFTYRMGDTKVKTFSKSTGLSDTGIKFIEYSKDEEAFILIYNNNNIDVLGLNDSITNMPEYKNSSLNDKTVNDVSIEGRNAYLATNSGVVVVNLRRREFRNTYSFGKAVNSCISVDGIIYAATTDGIYRGDEGTNLLDASNWTYFCRGNFFKLLYFGGQLYGGATDALYTISTEQGTISPHIGARYNYFNALDDRLIFGNFGQVVVLDSEGHFHFYNLNNDFQFVSFDGEHYWMSRGYNGLQPYTLENDTFKVAGDAVIPNSPVRNYAYWLKYGAGERLLVGGGSLNYTGQTYAGTIMTYKDGIWTNYNQDSIVRQTGLLFNNVTAVAEDPFDASHLFASTAGTGLYEFRNDSLVARYDYRNSPLLTILPNVSDPYYYVRVGALQFDKSGNLWMFNNQVDTVLHVKLADGGWHSYYFESLSRYPTFDKIIFDRRGWLWATHRRTTAIHHAGILCLNFADTPANTADDAWRFVYQFTNQDNTSYTFNLLYDIVEDRDGDIWIATDQGPFVLQTPTDIFTSSPVFTQIKVPRNDGTNYADYLLSGVPITAIAIDGGNRKWFGTNGNGVYLVSADGLETIHHFTAENSPLLSNTIYSLSVNGETGEVMIGTDAGLIGYRSDATDAQEELKESNIKVYPNPVRPEFSGNLRIDGLAWNSDVKITTVSGQLVAQGTSVGGTFTWNLKDKRNNRVATGVYYVIASNESGKKGAVAKFVVIK